MPECLSKIRSVLWSLAAAVSIAGGLTPCFAADQAGFHRWAIVSTLPARGTAIPDLLTAELSSSEGLQLVERDQVEQVLRELSLAELFDANGAGARARLGQLVGADALICLHADGPSSNVLTTPNTSSTGSPPAGTQKAKETIRVVITECKQGARLTVTSVEFDRSQPQEAVARIHELVDHIRRHYAGGVKQVVGVPPFISRSLTHEYDYLQTAFAEVLSSAIAASPGTAVIEFQEAQAIARELQLAGGSELSRQVPAFVEGEYEVPTNDQKREVRIRLQVKQAGTTEPRNCEFKSAGPAEAVELLLREGASLLQSAGSGDSPRTQSLSRDDQLKLLKSRAESFARLDSVEQSTDLREAILLLDPDDLDERCSLVEEYARRISRLSRWAQRGPQPDEEAKLLRRGQAIRFTMRAIDHVEFIIVNARVGKMDAVSLSQQACSNLHLLADPKKPGNVDLLEQAELREREFLKNVYPKILSLSKSDRDERYRGSLYKLWYDRFMELSWTHYAMRWDSPQIPDYTFLADVMENVVPETDTLPEGLYGFVFATLWEKPELGPERQHARVALFERLAKSKRRPNAFIGRLALLASEFNEPGRTDRLGTPDLLERLDAIERDYADLLTVNQNSQFILRQIRDRIGRKPASPNSGTVASRPTSRPDMYTSRVFHRRTPFEFRIPAELRNIAATRPKYEHDAPNQPLRVFQCGANLDVVWKRGFLGLHRTPGVVDVIAFDPAAEFADVAWDGKNAWVATRGKGIWLLDPSGEILDRIGPERGLPPADEVVRICTLGENKVVATGAFGRDHRAWIAVIEKHGADIGVNVFHEATRVSLLGDTEPQRKGDPACVFTPSYIRELKDYPSPGQSRIFIGRGRTGRDGLAPLEVDPKTWRVIVSEWQGPNDSIEEWDPHSVGKGQILAASPHYLFHIAAPDSAFPDGQTAHLLGKSPINQKELVFFDGKYYFLGRTWWRVDPTTMSAEMLYSVPNWRNPTIFATSAHYGLIWYYEWGEDVIFQAIIDPPHRVATRPASGPSTSNQ